MAVTALPIASLIAGRSYVLKVTVVNTSTSRDTRQPVAATMRVGVIGNFLAQAGSLEGVVTIQPPEQSYDFAPGESHDFEVPIDIPEGTIGVAGSSITAALLDPSGNVLISKTLSVRCYLAEISVHVINIPLWVYVPGHPEIYTHPSDWINWTLSDATKAVVSNGYGSYVSNNEADLVLPFNSMNAPFLLILSTMYYAQGVTTWGPKRFSLPGSGSYIVDAATNTVTYSDGSPVF